MDKYFQHRTSYIAEHFGDVDLYPHSFTESTTIPNILETYHHLENGNSSDDIVSIAGRILSLRASGKALLFLDLWSDRSKIQVMINRRVYKDRTEFNKIRRLIKNGDIVGITGVPHRSRTSEMSVLASNVILLSPCMHDIPAKLEDPELRFRNRSLDFIVNMDKMQIFMIRSQIIKYIRRYLDDHGYLEVETPILELQAGGATAKPFITHHNDLDEEMFLRIAPELYLKKLVVAGFNRVYEIGKQFRNESIDLTHNPEFTTCEFYCAYVTYLEMMPFTEALLSGLVHSICGKYQIEYNVTPESDPVVIDFTPPFRRISIAKELSLNGIDILEILALPDTVDQISVLTGILDDRQIECTPPHTVSRMIDKLIEYYIELHCVNPTFVIDHPAIMSPLAKYHRDNPLLTERFELFVVGRELCNAYTELNNPVVQRERFEQQLEAKKMGDDEAQVIDEGFCLALEYALPPTTGFGIGIDRLCMILANVHNIKEVLLFPTMKKID